MNPIFDHETLLAKSKSQVCFFGGVFGVEILLSQYEMYGFEGYPFGWW